MTIYAVYAPPPPDDDNADRIVFVRDGFSWAAMLFGPLWLIAHRLWLALLGLLAAGLVVGALSWLSGHDLSAVELLIALWLGFEGRAIRRWTLERAGYSLVGVVEADSREGAELRFFDRWPARRPDIRPPSGGPRPVASPGPYPLGLFPAPGGTERF